MEKFGLSRLFSRDCTFKSCRCYYPIGNTKQKVVKIIKQISKQGIEKLLKDGVIRHTHRGYVNPKNGEHIGFYKTCGGKKYIEDYYADLVMK